MQNATAGRRKSSHAGLARFPGPGSWLQWQPSLAALVLLGLLTLAWPVRAQDTIDFNVPGASSDLEATLRGSSLLLNGQAEGRNAPLDVMAAARAEYGRLIGLLYEDAYYAPVIRVLVDGREAADISPLSNPTQIARVEVNITLGPRFTFGQIAIAPLAPGTELPEDFAPGEPARSVTIRAALNAALDEWRAQGHPLVESVGQQVIANHAARQINVQLSLAPGPRLNVGAVIPEGNERTRDRRVVAIAGLRRGELHTPEEIEAAETRLRQTGTFSSVVLQTAQVANPDGTVDVTAQVVEALPRRIGFGVEIDSETGGKVSGFWLHRNLLGGAERLRLEAAVSGIASDINALGFALDARFIRPATFNRDTDLELGLNAARLREREYSADAYEATAIVVRRFGNTLRVSGGLSLRAELSDDSIDRDFGTFGVPMSVTRDTRDETLDATEGSYVFAEAMPYFGFSGAQSGLRLRFDARAYTDLGTSGRFVLAARGQLGAVVGPDLEATPRAFLFYSGGGGTVRGLPFQSLAVTEDGIVSGGRGFAGASGELRVRVSDNFSVVAFADAGTVSSGAFSGESDWHAGGGLGVRYATPIGPLRLDLATPIRRNEGAHGRSVQIYVGIGQAF